MGQANFGFEATKTQWLGGWLLSTSLCLSFLLCKIGVRIKVCTGYCCWKLEFLCESLPPTLPGCYLSWLRCGDCCVR